MMNNSLRTIFCVVKDSSKRVSLARFLDDGTASLGKSLPKNLRKLTWKNTMKISSGRHVPAK